MLVNDILYKSPWGEEISLFAGNIKVTAMDGLGSEVVIKDTEIYGQDGTYVNYISAKNRNITLTAVNFGSTGVSQAERVYELFPVGKPFTLTLLNDDLTRKISGIVHSVTPSAFTENDSFIISLFCGNPFFTDAKDSVVNNVPITDNFSFPFVIPCADGVDEDGNKVGFEFSIIRSDFNSILNNTGSETIGFTATFTTELPCGGLGLYNLDTSEYIRFTKELLPDERIVIDTRRGYKTITHYNVNGKTNILNTMTAGSTFFQLTPGKNNIKFEIENGSIEHLSVVYEWSNLYAGA